MPDYISLLYFLHGASQMVLLISFQHGSPSWKVHHSVPSMGHIEVLNNPTEGRDELE
jgi:hypothetical protein